MEITINTNYKTLKTLVPDVSKNHTPKGETLVASDNEILSRVKEGSGTIIVYMNGFFAYIDDQGAVTARAVANCHVMKYPKAEGGFNEVQEASFEDMPFPLVLSHFGMMNIEDAKRKEVKRHENISLDAENLPNDARLTVPNFADELDLDGESDIWAKRLARLPEALDCLTDRQREVVTLHYMDQMTQEQIADVVGLNQSSVSRRLSNALGRMEKFYEKSF